MLTKDLLRVSRAGGGYRPQFAGTGQAALAARVIGVYQGHVDESRERLENSLREVETEASDFKLVRGFAKLVEREATFETLSPVPPERARQVTFEAAEAVGVVTERERVEALGQAAEILAVTAEEVATSLYADLDARQILTGLDVRWSPDELIDRYNLSLAQTTLFDATEVRVRSADPKRLVSAVKRLGLMFEVVKTDAGRTVVVTGPDALFRSTRRYGTRFARLLRTLVAAPTWHLEATIDDDGTERELVLSHEDPIRVPDEEPVAEVEFDSSVEADFAARFTALDLDWSLEREPAPLATGSRVMIPDFAFDYAHAEFRVFFEIMGFWTPTYVEKKLDQLETVEDVELVVAVDESLGVAEAVEVHDHRVVTYSDRVRLKDVRDVLREYEADLVEAARDRLPEEVRPDRDVVTVATLADEFGVSEAAIAEVAFPEHERVGQTLVRPEVLEELAGELGPGIPLREVEAALERRGLTETSPVLAALGYRVAWDGLSGGRLERTR